MTLESMRAALAECTEAATVSGSGSGLPVPAPDAAEALDSANASAADAAERAETLAGKIEALERDLADARAATKTAEEKAEWNMRKLKKAIEKGKGIEKKLQG